MEFHSFIDNSCERGGVGVHPPRSFSIGIATSQTETPYKVCRHSSYGRWRQAWFSYRARGCGGYPVCFCAKWRHATSDNCPKTETEDLRGNSEAWFSYFGLIKPVLAEDIQITE